MTAVLARSRWARAMTSRASPSGPAAARVAAEDSAADTVPRRSQTSDASQRRRVLDSGREALFRARLSDQPCGYFAERCGRSDERDLHVPRLLVGRCAQKGE